MVLASVSQFNWEGIELGSVRSAWLYLALNPIIHVHTCIHTGTHTHDKPVGPLSASCTDRGTCWGHKRCLIGANTLSLSHTQGSQPLHSLTESVTQPDVVPDLLTPAG